MNSLQYLIVKLVLIREYHARWARTPHLWLELLTLHFKLPLQLK